MRIYTLLLLVLSLTSHAQFQYVAPMPGAKLIHPKHHIIIREGSLIDEASIQDPLFSITGSRSGFHSFRTVLSSDRKTILLYPDVPFAYAEEITVEIKPGLKSEAGNTLEGYSFRFTTHREYTQEEEESFRNLKSILMKEELKRWGVDPEPEAEADTRTFTGSISIVKNTSPGSGLVFYDAWSSNFLGSKYDGYAITNNEGDSIFQSAKTNYCQDFDLNPDGYLSVYNAGKGGFDILDSNYTVIDTYYPGNGRSGDVHEFTRYPDGTAVMIAGETQTVDMSVYNPNWSENAFVLGNVIQVFDADKNVVFEWRAFDHVDVTESNQNLSYSFIDYTHTNSIDLDTDGNLILSHRHLDQITKIDIQTGEFIWRLGGDSNQFVFTNDAEAFRWQHCARRTTEGNILLWDNGNTHSPAHSLAKEYTLDEVNMTATLSWSYQPKTYSNGNVYFFAMGSVQRLDNGNTLIQGGWDNSSNNSNIWEVTPSGEVVWEVAFDNGKSLVGYRAFRHEWNPCAPVAEPSVTVSKITDSSAKVSWGAVNNASSYDIQYRKIGTATWKLKNTTNTSRKLKNLQAGKSYEFQLRTNCQNGYTSAWTLPDTFTTAPGKYTELKDDGIASLYPNPAEDVLNLFIPETEGATVRLMDVSGKILQTIVEPAAGNEWLLLNVAGLPPGMYFIELNSGNGRYTARFVKD